MQECFGQSLFFHSSFFFIIIFHAVHFCFSGQMIDFSWRPAFFSFLLKVNVAAMDGQQVLSTLCDARIW